jgi:NAD(P)-dependent dehydrogenase (short-subunit alcohol dehydrogenase family)
MDLTEPTRLFDLTGKTAVVTGASRGIGEATARLLGAFGAHVIVSSRNEESCEAVVEKIRAAGGVASAMAAHVGDSAAIDKLFDRVRDRGFNVDILVNNAATNPYFGPMLDMEMSAFDKTVEVNIRGYFYATVRAAKRMRETGGGAIVNVASVNGRRAAPMQGVYSMTKAAIVSLTEGFAKELAPYNIRVNAVLPGLTDTKFASALTQNPAILGTMLKIIPLARVADPGEIAPMIAFLCTPAASYITGTSFPVDGGYLA